MPIDMRGIYLPDFGLQIEVSSVNGGRWHLVGACDLSGNSVQDPIRKPPGALPVHAYVRAQNASSTSAASRETRASKKKQSTSRKVPRKSARRAG